MTDQQLKAIRDAAEEDAKRDNTILLRPSLVISLLDEIERLKKDAERQFKDVERYWWIRDMDHWPAVFAGSNAPEPLRGAELDAAIDKAMEAK